MTLSQSIIKFAVNAEKIQRLKYTFLICEKDKGVKNHNRDTAHKLYNTMSLIHNDNESIVNLGFTPNFFSPSISYIGALYMKIIKS